MQKHIYKTIILFAIFVAALFFMSKNIKEEEIQLEKAVEMGEATFPLMYLDVDGYEVNRLHGYSSNIDASTIREAITPISQKKEIIVQIEENKLKIKKIKYEVRALKDNELLDSGSISALDQTETGKSVKIKLAANLLTSTEYAMKITAITDRSRKIHFYTRIKYYESDYFLNKKLDFITEFHNKSMDKKKAEELTKYLEADETSDNTNFAKVTIHSSFDMLSWGTLEPEVLTEIVPTIKEFNVETASVQLDYFIRLKNDSGTEVYNIKEFYRVRYTENRIYLLDYERKMEALFDIELTSLAKSEFKIGVTNKEDMELVTSAENGKLSFVRNGELWYYNLPENKIVQVFSFRGEDSDYLRNDYDQHDIRILNMDDGGNINFAVYGYMNRGDYEGKVALVLYHFSADTKRIEELVCIPLETTFQVLKEDIHDFSYVSQKGVFYFAMSDTVYSYNIAAKKLKVVVESISGDNFAFMEDNHGIAWIEQEGTKLVIMNLETEVQSSLESTAGEQYRIFGDIQSNLIFGNVKETDIKETKEGTWIMPAYSIQIMGVDGKVLKEYKQKKIYVVDAQVNGNIAKLVRVKKTVGGYKLTSEDSISSKEDAAQQFIGIETRVTDLMLNEKYISLPDGFAMEKKPKIYQTINMILSEDTTLHLPEANTSSKKYYVYAKGEITAALSEPAEAIRMADESMGVVVSHDNRLVWERSGRFNRKTIGRLKQTPSGGGVDSIGACLYMVFQHNQIAADAKKLSASNQSIISILEDKLENPINLTGCTLDQVLYFVSNGNPVIAMKNGDSAVLITAYDEFFVSYYDPAAGLIKTTLAKASKIFEDNGNVFISYMD